ncbi:MAG: hypothetical protein P4L43_17410 [Syntrophobacteraceae bacterium]|nr:hypothetical protein [Syntrophobacteraceae bacterium]
MGNIPIETEKTSIFSVGPGKAAGNSVRLALAGKFVPMPFCLFWLPFLFPLHIAVSRCRLAGVSDRGIWLTTEGSGGLDICDCQGMFIVDNLQDWGFCIMGAPMNLPAVPPVWARFANARMPRDGAIQLAAAGDIPCQGCPNGGSYGSTGMYLIGGKVLCYDCAVKMLGIANMDSAQRAPIMERYLLGGN